MNYHVLTYILTKLDHMKLHVCRSVKHSVAKFFGVADEDEAKRQRTLQKWHQSTRRVQNRSFVLSRRVSQRRTGPRSAADSRPTTGRRSLSAAQYEMSLHRPEAESAVSTQHLFDVGYDSTDSGVTSASTQRSIMPPHPLDPSATPPVYATLYYFCHFFTLCSLAVS